MPVDGPGRTAGPLPAPAAVAGRILAVARHQLVLLRRSPGPVITYTVMPALLTTFVEPLQGRLSDGSVAGIVRAAAGMLVMFSLFMTGVVGSSMVDERDWGTWDRLRSTPVRPLEVLVGKALPLLGALFAQQVVVLGFAAICYDLDLLVDPTHLIAVCAAWAVAVLGMGTLMSTLVRSHAQLSTVKDIGALLLSGLGGALVPVDALPSWIAPIAPASPALWAIRAYTDALSPGSGPPPGAAVAVLVLFCVGVAGFILGAIRTAR
jgi:ABC-2 type transport system permease protein